jgi:integrase
MGSFCGAGEPGDGLWPLQPCAKRTRILHHALAQAVRSELIPRNVASLAPSPRVPVAEIAVPSAADLSALLDGLQGHPIWPVAQLAVGTGLRRGELCALRWRDLDLDAGAVSVTRSLEQTKAGLRIKEPKTRHGRRRISLPQSTAEVLRDHYREALADRLARGVGRPSPEDYIFQEPGTGCAPWPPNQLSWAWARLLRRLRLPVCSFHALRHCHASALIAAGVDPMTVSRRLGHATPAFTLSRYGHLWDGADAAAAQAFDRLAWVEKGSSR